MAFAPSDVFFGMVRMGQAYADDEVTGWNTYVARSRKDAEDWLRSKLDDDVKFNTT